MNPLLTPYVRDPDGATFDFYLQHGGYDGLKAALAITPDQVIEMVKASGLRGRGVWRGTVMPAQIAAAEASCHPFPACLQPPREVALEWDCFRF